ncbi:hypothetical protein PoMZ_09503 [Pyricularia oryzae]|uniref:Uncharacterized protein n=1 Tax=Pyricularia oryzae TaxID=318829 RepID=A0A4P7MUU7_PYROR|nr:hypothetical protein PoMZ_09503 [Pyricularia oryzae]
MPSWTCESQPGPQVHESLKKQHALEASGTLPQRLVCAPLSRTCFLPTPSNVKYLSAHDLVTSRSDGNLSGRLLLLLFGLRVKIRLVQVLDLVDDADHEAAAWADGDVGLAVLQVSQSDLEAIAAGARVVVDLERLVVRHVLDLDLVVDGDFFLVGHF